MHSDRDSLKGFVIPLNQVRGDRISIKTTSKYHSFFNKFNGSDLYIQSDQPMLLDSSYSFRKSWIIYFGWITDLLWTIFCFSYVIATMLTGVALLSIYFIGLPVLAVFAYSWTLIAQYELNDGSKIVVLKNSQPSAFEWCNTYAFSSKSWYCGIFFIRKLPVTLILFIIKMILGTILLSCTMFLIPSLNRIIFSITQNFDHKWSDRSFLVEITDRQTIQKVSKIWDQQYQV